jgi:hypothetical protein
MIDAKAAAVHGKYSEKNNPENMENLSLVAFTRVHVETQNL